MKITAELQPEMLQAILLTYADRQKGYNKSWAWWAHDHSGYTHEVILGVLNVQVVDVQEKEYDSYGNIENDDLTIVFKVTSDIDGEVLHYKKTGTASSYGGDEWGGVFRRVEPVERTVWEYR
jgi:hypothetical protein